VKIGEGVDIVVDGILIEGGGGAAAAVVAFGCDGLSNSAVRPAPTEALAAAISIVDFDIVTCKC